MNNVLSAILLARGVVPNGRVSGFVVEVVLTARVEIEDIFHRYYVESVVNVLDKAYESVHADLPKRGRNPQK